MLRVGMRECHDLLGTHVYGVGVHRTAATIDRYLDQSGWLVPVLGSNQVV